MILLIFACLALGSIDYLIGPQLSFSVFYTGPIVLAAWYGSRRAGIFLALFSALVWMYVDISVSHSYTSMLIPIWNSLVRLAFFLIILHLLIKLKDKLAFEESLADTDPLTGLANRRYFIEQIENENQRVKRHPEPFTIAYIDLDNFKYVNDTLGHDVGDQLLEVVARYLKEHTRALDTTARLGGDEFALLFPALDNQGAVTALQQMQKKLLHIMQEFQWPVTFSIGAITFDEHLISIRDAIKAVDDLMYQVKKTGKNNIQHKNWSNNHI